MFLYLVSPIISEQNLDKEYFYFEQKKLEGELQMIEDKFEVKKRKFIESSEVFSAELKKVS